jgi:sarcosine oxidase delta subunit
MVPACGRWTESAKLIPVRWVGTCGEVDTREFRVGGKNECLRGDAAQRCNTRRLEGEYSAVRSDGPGPREERVVYIQPPRSLRRCLLRDQLSRLPTVGVARVTTSISSSNPHVRFRRSICAFSARADRKKPLPVGLRVRQLSVLLAAAEQQSDWLKSGQRAPPFMAQRSVTSITCGLYQNGYNGNDRSARQTFGVAG